jgi:SRSO17 transposase
LLVGRSERRNAENLAEQVDGANARALQRFLTDAPWSVERVTDRLQEDVAHLLEDPDAAWVVDETGFTKQGTKLVGVARQYSGTAGRVENCQIGVFLTYATSAGRTFLDRELYLPRAWTEDRNRCAAAGIGDDVEFKTKPELAMAMLRRAHAGGVPAGWVAADEVYGSHYKLRETCEELGYSYVLAVAVNQHVIAGPDRFEGQEFRADTLIAALPAQSWQRHSAGKGSKGERLYDWARIRVHGPEHPGSVYWLMARRNLNDPGDLAYYLCHAAARTSLGELARVAGIRWTIEETFQTAKGQTGLDHYQVRQYTGWYRHITLSMLAHAFLTVTRSKKGAPIPATATSSP